MKKAFLAALFALLCLPLMSDELNLTPVPKQITVTGGAVSLPASFAISTATLADSVAVEAERFAKHLSAVTGCTVVVGDYGDDAFMKMAMYSGSDDIGCEGYTLDITSDGVSISANTTHGFYYAFQTIKKLLPPCVMAGVKDSNVTRFELPLLSITDAPRFEYRGFMLDVCRHYFDLAQIKRMIDVMSYYKMNRFHWHLSDDQGWRIEIKKYPKLTTVGATRSNSWSVDPEYGGYYTNEPYGPYFYTQDEARELVAYAKERHIEIIPEVEFPGHACAALTAYPEYSCSPDGSHSVKVDGGIYSDVFNVGNPATLRFAKDVLDEITEIFPYTTIHIGGDECPTSAWSNNEECLAMMNEMGFSDIRELQSLFVRRLSDHLSSKEDGKKRDVIMWNESLSASGTNIDLIKGTGGTMMCWENGKVQSTALQAAKLGMKSIITPWGPYYINRKQSTDPGEPVGAGYGNDDVQATYEYVPVPSSVPASLRKYYCGVQGTFWTEHVQSKYLLEYLALPRLIAIAETGWTPAAKKNFDDFRRRITADSVLLNYNGYEYGRHFMQGDGEADKVMPVSSTDNEKHWYRIVTGATDAARSGRCIELLREGASAIGTGNARAGRLWNGVPADEGDAAYDYQQWAFMENPDAPGMYALVCKAKPDGSVNGTPTASNNTARWDYDETTRHYDFILGEAVYAKNGDCYRYSIHSQKAASGMYMNMAGAGQNYSINMWNNPNDGNSGVWELQPMSAAADSVTTVYPQAGDFVRIVNNVPRFAGLRIVDDGGDNAMTSAADYSADVWEVVQSAAATDGQNVTLRNVATGRYLSGTSSPIALAASESTYKLTWNTKTGDYSILAGADALFPMPERATVNAGTLAAGGIYPQGTGWNFEPAWQITYECSDESGNPIGRYHRSVSQGDTVVCTAPAIKNMEVVGYGEDCSPNAPVVEAVGHTTVKVVYRRSAFAVVIRCVESRGGIIAVYEESCPAGDSIVLEYPRFDYYTAQGGDVADGASVVAVSDTVCTVTYSTDGLCGFSAIGDAVYSVESGKSYLLFNNKNENSRNGFLNVSAVGNNILTDNGATSGSPAYVWHLTGSDNYMKVGNALGCYIPALTKGSANKASGSGGSFSFTYNSNHFIVRGTNGLYWNGNSDHTFTGWSEGHPFIVYEYYVHPYFLVSVECVDDEGNTLGQKSSYMPAGEPFTLNADEFEGYRFVRVEGASEGVNTVDAHLDITLHYVQDANGIDTPAAESLSDGTIYDLTGRKITSPVKGGIYIQGGRKYIVR